jgi:hypothetical protein
MSKLQKKNVKKVLKQKESLGKKAHGGGDKNLPLPVSGSEAPPRVEPEHTSC